MIIFSVNIFFFFRYKFSAAIFITFFIISINIIYTNIFMLIFNSTCNIDILFAMLNLLTVVYISDLGGGNSHYTTYDINLVNMVIKKGSGLIPRVVDFYTRTSPAGGPQAAAYCGGGASPRSLFFEKPGAESNNNSPKVFPNIFGIFNYIISNYKTNHEIFIGFQSKNLWFRVVYDCNTIAETNENIRSGGAAGVCLINPSGGGSKNYEDSIPFKLYVQN